ncbi:MAG: diacylglycerol kinase family lipid kinase [Erysipelotrichaceae bacterium]|nr:diacylglycerol kinase family lipid kinase [Erysipelotrichaceae bacterium]
MKYVFLVNPFSGKKQGKAAAEIIYKCCKERNLDYQIIMTEYPNHATELAQTYSNADTVIFSVGGDGTALETAKGIKDGTMAILPCGTGNDYYKMIAPYHSLEETLNKTLDGKIVQVDLGETHRGTFLNCLSLGLDAQVNHIVSNKMRNNPLPGSIKYVIAAFRELLRPVQPQITLIADGEKIEQTVTLAAVMLGNCYGGGFHPTPRADLQDGMFDLCIVQALPRRRMLQLILKYKAGKHEHLKEVQMLKAKEVTIISKEPVIFQYDGESFIDTQVTMKCHTHRIQMLVPKESLLHE